MNIFNFKVVILALLVSSCNQGTPTQNTTTISVSACKETTTQGEVIDCEPSGNAARKLRELNQVDHKFPGPKLPSLNNLYSVVSVNDDASITLQNGETLALAGVDCGDPDLIKYLHGLFLESNRSKLGYIETGYIKNRKKYAYIWDVDTDFGSGGGNEFVEIGPSISSTNETALMSGWCDPIDQTNHIYYQRYQSISKIAD